MKTSSTLRNALYFATLKEGRLKGSKHGKWLFTDEDIKEFLKKGKGKRKGKSSFRKK